MLVIIVKFLNLHAVNVLKVYTNSKLNTLVDEFCFSRRYPMNNNDTEKLHMLTTILNENMGVIVGRSANLMYNIIERKHAFRILISHLCYSGKLTAPYKLNVLLVLFLLKVII